MTQSPNVPMPQASEAFFDSALRRVQLMMLALGAAATLTALLVLGWPVALGVAAGCVTTYVNFRWLKQVISGLAEKAVETGEAQPARGIVYRFLLRYLLLAIAI